MKRALRFAILLLAAIASVIGLFFVGIVMLLSMPVQFVRDCFQLSPKPRRPVPLEEQCATLVSCGIEIDRTLLLQVPIQHAIGGDYVRSMEQQPYEALLRAAGTAVSDPETQQVRAASPRVFTFGADWIDEADSYCGLLSSCAAVVDARIENLSVRCQNESVILTFHHAGHQYSWRLSGDSQYIDEKFFDLVPTLKLGNAGKSLYWVGEPGDCVIGLAAVEAEQVRTTTGLELQPWS